MPPQKKYRVSREVLDRGARLEAKEHPEFSERSSRRIARGHIERYGPGYYSPAAEKVHDAVVKKENERLHAKPMKRKPPLQDGPFFTDINRVRF